MGACCPECNQNDQSNIYFPTKDKNPLIKFEVTETVIDNTKRMIYLKLNPTTDIKIKNPNIELLIIHVETTPNTKSASRQVIEEGETRPFIYNTHIQTIGRKKDLLNWPGGIIGNVYTTTCIPLSYIPDELNDDNIISKIVSISIFQVFDELAHRQFLLKDNDDNDIGILCINNQKLGELIIENDNNKFMLINFGLNIVDIPEEDKKK